jgi:formimidoylglutamate deiminase
MTRTARIPAMANAHSHAFQLDLRGAGERLNTDPPAPDFWSWRTEMYRLASSHTPETMGEVGGRVYGQMAAAGYGAVGEFHYVHHQPDGTPYAEPNAMAIALARAARAAGLEITLLPAAYHRGGPGKAPDPGQVRFCDPSVEAFLGRVDALREWAAGEDGVSVGVAAHSVRAVPAEWLEAIARYSDEHGLARHVHASEQRRELAECEAEHGCSPIELLARTGFLGPRTSVIHAIHVSDGDIALLAESESIVVTCPTTEGNLGDGFLPGLRYRDAGVRLAIGTDEQTRIDPFEELREMETLARREGHTRFALLAAAGGDLWGQMMANGRASLGLAPAPVPEIALDLDHPDLAGVAEGDLMLAVATCASAGVVRAGVSP